MGDAGLGAHSQVVEHRHPGGLAAGTGGGGHGHQGLEGPRDRLAAANGVIDVGQQLGGVGGVEVGRLGGVDAGAAAHGGKAVATALLGGADRLSKRGVARLHPGFVVADRVDAGAAQGLARHRHRFQLRHYRIGNQQHAAHAERAQLEAQLAGRAGPELDARPLHVEDRLSGHNRGPHDAPFGRRVGSSIIIGEQILLLHAQFLWQRKPSDTAPPGDHTGHAAASF